MKFTSVEKEIIFLKASIESIASMVNYEILQLSEGHDGAQAIFKTSIHQRLFNILLVDFLSKSAEEITGENISSLDALVKICEKPTFTDKQSVRSLRSAVKRLTRWLEQEIKVKVWFPSVGLDTELKLQRKEFIKICGDISKHSFSRLHVRARELKNIFKRNGREITNQEALLLLVEFYEKFHIDIFSYHASSLVEKLNDIRWGIQNYLLPEMKRSLVYEASPPRYSYSYPADLKDQFARHCYRDLLSEIKASPYIKKFKTYKILKLRY